jgi:hypothetical protein
MSSPRLPANMLKWISEGEEHEEENLLAMLETDEFLVTTERRSLHFLDLPVEIHLRILHFVCDLSVVSLSLTWYVIVFIFVDLNS